MTELKDIICPITQQIFREPVVVSDGHIYEEYAIRKWIIEHETSPMTREVLSNKFYKCMYIKQIVSKFIKDNEKLKDDMYPSILMTNDINHLFRDYELFDRIDLSDFSHDQLMVICKTMTTRMINKITDLELIYHIGYKLIHYMVENNSNFDTIKYLIDKGVDLESTSHNNVRPIHIACYSSNIDVINYLVEKGVSLETATGKLSIIQYSCGYCEPKVLKYWIKNGIKLNHELLDILALIKTNEKFKDTTLEDILR